MSCCRIRQPSKTTVSILLIAFIAQVTICPIVESSKPCGSITDALKTYLAGLNNNNYGNCYPLNSGVYSNCNDKNQYCNYPGCRYAYKRDSLKRLTNLLSSYYTCNSVTPSSCPQCTSCCVPDCTKTVKECSNSGTCYPYCVQQYCPYYYPFQYYCLPVSCCLSPNPNTCQPATPPPTPTPPTPIPPTPIPPTPIPPKPTPPIPPKCKKKIIITLVESCDVPGWPDVEVCSCIINPEELCASKEVSNPNTRKKNKGGFITRMMPNMKKMRNKRMKYKKPKCLCLCFTDDEDVKPGEKSSKQICLDKIMQTVELVNDNNQYKKKKKCNCMEKMKRKMRKRRRNTDGSDEDGTEEASEESLHTQEESDEFDNQNWSKSNENDQEYQFSDEED